MKRQIIIEYEWVGTKPGELGKAEEHELEATAIDYIYDELASGTKKGKMKERLLLAPSGRKNARIGFFRGSWKLLPLKTVED